MYLIGFRDFHKTSAITKSYKDTCTSATHKLCPTEQWSAQDCKLRTGNSMLRKSTYGVDRVLSIAIRQKLWK